MGPLTEYLGLALGFAGVALVLVGAVALLRRRREGRYGTLVGVDLPSGPGTYLRSDRYGLAGRPDELRRDARGRLVPVEFKSRPSPPTGLLPSHRIQVGAYCLLVEDVSGQPPPFGVVRYADGTEVRVPWDAALRAEVLRVRAAVGRPYDGRATPSPGRCRRCAWRDACDVRAV